MNPCPALSHVLFSFSAGETLQPIHPLLRMAAVFRSIPSRRRPSHSATAARGSSGAMRDVRHGVALFHPVRRPRHSVVHRACNVPSARVLTEFQVCSSNTKVIRGLTVAAFHSYLGFIAKIRLHRHPFARHRHSDEVSVAYDLHSCSRLGSARIQRNALRPKRRRSQHLPVHHSIRPPNPSCIDAARSQTPGHRPSAHRLACHGPIGQQHAIGSASGRSCASLFSASANFACVI